MRPLLADPALKPGPEDMARATAMAQDLLRVRFSSPLFRLGTAELIQERVSFGTGGPDQPAGVIVMEIDDRPGSGDGSGLGDGSGIDPDRERVVVVFNATPDAQTVGLDDASSLRLHEIQASGADDVVRETEVGDSGVTVPARTVAVLEQ